MHRISYYQNFINSGVKYFIVYVYRKRKTEANISKVESFYHLLYVVFSNMMTQTIFGPESKLSPLSVIFDHMLISSIIGPEISNKHEDWS